MRWSLLVLGVVAASPFALLRCKSAGEPPPAATPVASVPVDAGVASTSASVVIAPAFTLPPPPTYDAVACPPIESALAKVWSDQACKIDADCSVGYGHCSCGSAIAARALPKLHAVNRDFEDHGCFMKHPIPCPSCPPPPAPKCVGGRCR